MTEKAAPARDDLDDKVNRVFAGKVVRKVHNRVAELCKPGITTRELDDEA